MSDTTRICIRYLFFNYHFFQFKKSIHFQLQAKYSLDTFRNEVKPWRTFFSILLNFNDGHDGLLIRVCEVDTIVWIMVNGFQRRLKWVYGYWCHTMEYGLCYCNYLLCIMNAFSQTSFLFIIIIFFQDLPHQHVGLCLGVEMIHIQQNNGTHYTTPGPWILVLELTFRMHRTSVGKHVSHQLK